MTPPMRDPDRWERHRANAEAFAAALEPMFTRRSADADDTHPDEHGTEPTAADLMEAIRKDHH